MKKFFASFEYSADEAHIAMIYAASLKTATEKALVIARECNSIKDPVRINVKEVDMRPEVYEWMVEYTGINVSDGRIFIEAPDIINAAILAKAKLFGFNVYRITRAEGGGFHEDD